MDVYADSGPSGRYDVPLVTNVPCQFFHVGRTPPQTGIERAELGALRNLHYSPDVTLTEGCQLEVVEYGELRRYNVVTGTDGVIAPFGVVIQRRCDVVRSDG